MRLAAAIISLLFPLLVSAQILPTNRTPAMQGNWIGLSGVPSWSPIPPTNGETVYASFTSGASESSIQTALNACPNGQVVFLNDGTYEIHPAQLVIPNNGVQLVCASTNTVLNLGTNALGILIGNTGWSTDWQTPNSANHANLTNGFTGTALQVDNVGSAAPGEILWIDMLNDTNASALGAQGTPDPNAYTSVACPNTGTNRYQFQCAMITSVSGNTINIATPLLMNNWGQAYTNGLDPQVWWSSPGCSQHCGIQNGTITGTGVTDAAGIYLQNCFGCWVVNCNVTGVRYGISAKVTDQCEIRHSWVYGQEITTDDYDFQILSSTAMKMEDNTASKPGTSLILSGVSGSVFAYNYFTNVTGQPGWMQGGICLHSGNPNMNLFEGNSAPGWWVQNNFGSSEYNTAFRNRLRGIDEANAAVLTGDIEAVNLSAQQPQTSLIGNVLGTTGTNTWYEDTGASYTCHDMQRVFLTAEGHGGCYFAYDAVTANTFLRSLNWDSANGSIVDAGGHSVGELPASLYLTSKPSYFGALNWPPVDPSNPAYSSSITNIPAGYRFVFGVDPPSQFTNAPASAGGGIPPEWAF